VFSEPAGYMGAFCRTCVTQMDGFAAPEFESAAGIFKKWKGLSSRLWQGGFGEGGGAAVIDSPVLKKRLSPI